MGYKRGPTPRIDIEKAMIQFYNRIAQAKVETIEQIPAEPLALLFKMTYEELARPLIRDDAAKGLNGEQLLIKWGLTERKTRTIIQEIKKAR